MARRTLEIPMGDRIRFHREARRKTQAVVAGLAGISDDYLSQIERGLKIPTIGLLDRIADVLRVSPADLLDPLPAVERDPEWDMSAVAQAMTAPWLQQPSEEVADLKALAAWVDIAWSRWQTAQHRFSATARLLPQLIIDAEAAMRELSAAEPTSEWRRACGTASDLYFLLRSFCKRAGSDRLSLLAADRGLRTAEASGEELRVAAARWNLGHALLGTGDFGQASAVAQAAASRLEMVRVGHDSRETVSMLGALYLLAADADTRDGASEKARERLHRRAREAAVRSGEGNVFWTVFGPTNVRIHAVGFEREVGRPATALDLARTVDASTSVSVERRMTFALDLARCWEQRGDDAAVLHHLLTAERCAPEDLRVNPEARDLLRGLIVRARRSTAPDIHALAERLKILDAERRAE